MNGKFEMGQVVQTAGSMDKLNAERVQRCLKRHHSGDWGDIADGDEGLNDQALMDGTRLFSVYKDVEGPTFWIITEHDRSVTTVLLPSEY